MKNQWRKSKEFLRHIEIEQQKITTIWYDYNVLHDIYSSCGCFAIILQKKNSCAKKECSSHEFISVNYPVRPRSSAADRWIGQMRFKYLVYHSKHSWGRWQWLSSIPHIVYQPPLRFKSHSEQPADTPVRSLPFIQSIVCIQVLFWASDSLCVHTHLLRCRGLGCNKLPCSAGVWWVGIFS